jgi:spectinomycin phosphotransferase
VDTPPPPDLDEEALRRAVLDGWDVPADEIRYVPKGAGSYHWVASTAGAPSCFLTVDDLETKPWISDCRDDVFHGLAAAYGAASALEHDAGIWFAVGPLRGRDGSVVRRVSDRYSLAVFPFVEGIPGAWGDPLEPATRDALIKQLAELHRTPAATDLGLSRRSYELPERDALIEAMDQRASHWTGGPMSEPARRELAAHAGDVTSWLAELDALAGQLDRAEVDPVVTHGEPHPGNLIRTQAGLRLIDWDTVALAPPERDLWMLDDPRPGCLLSYEELTGHTVSQPALRFYRLAWALGDVASFVEMFRAPHHETEWLGKKLAELRRLLEGEPPAPYGSP